MLASSKSALYNVGLIRSIKDGLRSYPLYIAAAYNELITPSSPSCIIDTLKDINIRDPWGYTALIRCCMGGSLDSLRVLINRGANVGLVNEASGVVALH